MQIILSTVTFDTKGTLKKAAHLKFWLWRRSLLERELWVTRKKEESKLEATEMKMLSRKKGVKLKDRKRSEDIQRDLGIKSIGDKPMEIRLRWYGHVLRMDKGNELKE